jgi:hypothetical protein
MDRAVVDDEPLAGDGEDDDPDDGGVVLGDGDLAVADDRGVVVGHRAGQHPEAFDVVPVGGVDERGDARASDSVAGRSEQPPGWWGAGPVMCGRTHCPRGPASPQLIRLS